MQILIRHIHRDRKGREELLEEVLDDPVVTVGHGSNQVIQLLDPGIAQRHLELKASSGGAFSFRTIGTASVAFQGKAQSRGRLKPGDELELGAQTIAVTEPPAEFDAALEVTVVEQEAEIGPATHYRTQLSQTGLGARKTSWALFVAILVLFLVVPLAGYFWPGIGGPLRDTPFLPSDHAWLSGPLSNVHHTPEIGRDCNACHASLFERAPDRACLDCHSGIEGHVDLARVEVPALDATRCAACHEEHNEPANLVREDADLCVDCHESPADVATVSGEGDLPEPAGGFTAASHPEFRLAMLRPGGQDGSWSIERVRWSGEDARETSNLKFPHDVHLDPGKVESLRTGEPLTCGNCHELDDDGEHFLPIAMERTCRDCHSLSFDDDFPRKQMPHGDVAGAIVAMEEHFIRKFADPELRGDGDARARRRPGRSDAGQRCEGSALECGRQRAMQEAVSQFSRSGCVTCHEVAEDPAKPMLERWQVRPVRLDDDWYPFARFDHEAHLTQSRSQHGGDAACATCHAANDSDHSEDVLIPGQDNCLQCHGEGSDESLVELSCRGCHDFHLPFRGVMRTVDSASGETAGRNVTQKERGTDDG